MTKMKTELELRKRIVQLDEIRATRGITEWRYDQAKEETEILKWVLGDIP
jgi:hypothetical protein